MIQSTVRFRKIYTESQLKFHSFRVSTILPRQETYIIKILLYQK